MQKVADAVFKRNNAFPTREQGREESRKLSHDDDNAPLNMEWYRPDETRKEWNKIRPSQPPA